MARSCSLPQWKILEGKISDIGRILFASPFTKRIYKIVRPINFCTSSRASGFGHLFIALVRRP